VSGLDGVGGGFGRLYGGIEGRHDAREDENIVFNGYELQELEVFN